ncbi:MAG: two-component regulator propeller domain-containing protein [Bacteroidota bacterium]
MYGKILLFIVLVSLLSIASEGCKKNDPGAGQNIGPAWVTFTIANSPLYGNNIRAIFVDGGNYVWFATNNGASYFLKGNWGGLRDSLSSNNGGQVGYTINGITQSKDGSIWFALQGGGIVRYLRNGTQFQYKRYIAPEIPSNTPNCIAGMISNASLGQVFAGYHSYTIGVGKYTPSQVVAGDGQWNELDAGTSPLPSNYVWTANLNLHDNTVWFGTYDQGAAQYDGANTWRQIQLPDIYSFPILSIAFDNFGQLWLAKNDSGVSVLNYNTGVPIHHYTYLNTRHIMPQGPVNAIAINNFNNNDRFFGTKNGGLIELNDTTWTTYTTANTPALPSNNITALAYDTYGNLWIGTSDGGVAVYNPAGTRFGN